MRLRMLFKLWVWRHRLEARTSEPSQLQTRVLSKLQLGIASVGELHSHLLYLPLTWFYLSFFLFIYSLR
ncbi:hypothetical protein T459_33731 [Capsicum annuum]|uniref:Uncharacterized protein n=1 Tax=Capsicum annuum TaxID=4072 RepID=A0A2G2XY39_CAPAN|nr:hypothetical protein T459_33731 [Capsicum annuum]